MKLFHTRLRIDGRRGWPWKMNDQFKCVVLKCSQTNVRLFFVQTVSDSVTQLSLSTDLISRPHIHTCIRTYVRMYVYIYKHTCIFTCHLFRCMTRCIHIFKICRCKYTIFIINASKIDPFYIAARMPTALACFLRTCVASTLQMLQNAHLL